MVVRKSDLRVKIGIENKHQHVYDLCALSARQKARHRQFALQVATRDNQELTTCQLLTTRDSRP